MNQLNDLFEGLTQGAAGLAQGFLQKDLQKSALSIMQKGMSRLEQLMNPEPTYQDNAGNPLSRGQVNLDNSQQVSEPDYKAGLQQLYQLQTELAPFGDLGKQYGSQLESFWNNSLDLNRPPKKDIREVNGQLVDITNGTPQVLFGEKKEKPVKKSVEEWGKMSYEDILKEAKTDDELLQAYYLANPETQQRIYDNYKFVQDAVDQNYKEGIYTPKLPGRRGPSGRFNPRSFDEGADVSAFKNIAQTVEKIDNQQETTDEQNQKYNQNIYDLSKKYNLPVKVIQSVADKINNANGPKEVTKILRSLKNDDFYSDVGTSQEQMNWDANYLNQWEQYLNDVYQNDPANYDAEKKKFWKDLDDIFARGSLTKSEYNNYKKKYF